LCMGVARETPQQKDCAQQSGVSHRVVSHGTPTLDRGGLNILRGRRGNNATHAETVNAATMPA